MNSRPPGVTLLACGHEDREVSWGRCWPCHLAFLRETGDGARADRLEAVQRQRLAGLVDWDRLVADLLTTYESEP